MQTDSSEVIRNFVNVRVRISDDEDQGRRRRGELCEQNFPPQPASHLQINIVEAEQEP